MSGFAKPPTPPYYAVIFSNQLSSDRSGYDHMAEQMVALAAEQPGFLGVESTRDANGFGITISYWESPEAIKAWRDKAEHQVAQRIGKDRWYDHFELRIAKVERAYSGPKPNNA